MSKTFPSGIVVDIPNSDFSYPIVIGDGIESISIPIDEWDEIKNFVSEMLWKRRHAK